MAQRPPRRAASLAPLLALAVLATAGCRKAPPAAAPGGPSPGDRYLVRGQIVRFAPPEAGPGLSIRHEAIPEFRDKDGVAVGMMPMAMFFPVAKGVSLEGLAPGDKVRFGFVMDWAAARFEIDSIERLPPGTSLDFGEAPPDRPPSR